MYNDPSGLEDLEDATETLHDTFEDAGYHHVVNIRNGHEEPTTEPLEGRWRGELAEGLTAELVAVNDEVVKNDQKHGLWANEPVDGVEYLLKPEQQTLAWLPTVWTTVIENNRWDPELWYEWTPETEEQTGPAGYRRWRADAERCPVRPIGRYGHTQDGDWHGARIPLTLWLTDSSPTQKTRPVWPEHTPPLPATIVEHLADQR